MDLSANNPDIDPVNPSKMITWRFAAQRRQALVRSRVDGVHRFRGVGVLQVVQRAVAARFLGHHRVQNEVDRKQCGGAGRIAS